jgi:hypothetical protein
MALSRALQRLFTDDDLEREARVKGQIIGREIVSDNERWLFFLSVRQPRY